MEIDDLQNECVRETEDDLNRRFLRNHKEVNKGCYLKKKSPVWAFYLPFRKFAFDDGAIWYYCTLCHCVETSTQQVTMKGVLKYTKKNSSLRNRVLHGNANKFTSFLSLLELRKTSQPDNASELITYDGSIKRIKDNEVSVGGRLSYYLLPFHPYEDNNPKQRNFEGNAVALMAHEFTSLSLVENDCLLKLTQDLDPRLHPVGLSKLSRSLIPTEKKPVERSVIERLEKLKAVVISYVLWMSCKIEALFLLKAHYCIGTDRNNTHIGIPNTTANDDISLSLYVMGVVENFGLEEKIVGITSDGGGNLWFCREALE